MTSGADDAGAIGFLAVPELFRRLIERKATGQLVAYRDETVKKVYFKSGAVLFAMSNLVADRLGDVLLARGMITREQYEESARQVLATGRKQGTVLVHIGALTPKELFRGLIAQVREIALSLFAWDAGSWRFLEGTPSQEEELVNLRLNAGGLVFEGLGRVADDPRWQSIWQLERMELRALPTPPLSIDEVDAPDAARRLLALVEQERPVEELPRLAGCDPARTAALLYALTLLGIIDARPRPLVQPPLPAPQPAATSDEARQLREKVSALAARLERLTHYQLLGLAPEADVETIKRSYIALAKEFHPDRFFRPEFEDLQETVNGIFMRINEVYSTLQNPAARAEYDRQVLRLTAPVARIKEPEQDSRIAQEQFKKGLTLLSAGDLWAAIQSLRWAVNLAPQSARYHTWLGVALTRSKKRLHEAEEHCKTAIALDANEPDHYLHLGQVYRAGHLPEKAKRQFELALRLDPRHQAALKELRELEGAPAPEKGLFDRLLRK